MQKRVNYLLLYHICSENTRDPLVFEEYLCFVLSIVNGHKLSHDTTATRFPKCT